MLEREQTLLCCRQWRGICLSAQGQRQACDINAFLLQHAEGEFTLVVGGAPEEAGTRAEELARIVAILLKTQSPSQTAAIAAEITGASRKEAYRVAEEIKARGA